MRISIVLTSLLALFAIVTTFNPAQAVPLAFQARQIGAESSLAPVGYYGGGYYNNCYRPRHYYYNEGYYDRPYRHYRKNRYYGSYSYPRHHHERRYYRRDYGYDDNYGY